MALKAAPDIGTEDLQSIENDINKLAQKYIFPIDRIRSIVRPKLTVTSSPKAEINKKFTPDPDMPPESRAHAFYRMLGFPVATSQGFYNPGMDPLVSRNDDSKKAVNTQVNNSSVYKNEIIRRETLVDSLRNLFIRQDSASAVYAYLLRFSRPFGVMDESFMPFEKDLQSFEVSSRGEAFEKLKKNNPAWAEEITGLSSVFSSTVLGPNVSEGAHILKPFTVDPQIAGTVQPSSRLIAVPFLPKKQDLKLEEPSVYLQRPGIEAILRIRLKNSIEDTIFLENVRKILNNEISPGEERTSLDRNSIVSTISALSDENELVDISSVFDSVSSVQISVISRLVKTLKAVVRVYVESMKIIDEAIVKIGWIPQPSIDGPETGASGATLIQTKSGLSAKIEKRIAELRVKSSNAKRRLYDIKNLGEFACPFEVSVGEESSDKYDRELNKITRERDRYAYDAFVAMGNMEIISGEVSGLGLIDILAIYIALWAIDEQFLLGFLDNNSFERLINYNTDLITDTVSDLHASGAGTAAAFEIALAEFEKKLINVLSFVDKELERYGVRNPAREVGGTIES